jgi:hypothetical protein
MQVKGVAHCENSQSHMIIQPVGTELQKKLFPEIEF